MNCNGCASLLVDYVGSECSYTTSGIKDLLDCPCKECLIKVMCQKRCYNFESNKYKVINENRYMFGLHYYKSEFERR